MENYKSSEYTFLQMVSKFSWSISRTFLEICRPWGLSDDQFCRVTREEIRDLTTGCLVREKSGNSLYSLNSQGKVREFSEKSGNFSEIKKYLF